MNENTPTDGFYLLAYFASGVLFYLHWEFMKSRLDRSGLMRYARRSLLNIILVPGSLFSLAAAAGYSFPLRFAVFPAAMLLQFYTVALWSTWWGGLIRKTPEPDNRDPYDI